MQRDADPFAARVSRSPNTSIDDTQRDHRNREHVERRGAGRQRSAGSRSTAGSRAPSTRRADVEQQRDVASRSSCVGGDVEHERQQRERQHADEHLPGEEIERVERRARAGSTSSRSCPPPSRTPTARPTAWAPGRPAQSHGSTTSVRPANASATAIHCAPRTRSPQHGPREQQRPERHREHEHRRAAGAAAGERHRRRAEVDRRLEEAGDDDRRPATAAAAGRASPHQHGEQRRRPRARSRCTLNDDRVRVLERELHHDPVRAPHQREHDERDVGAAPRVHEMRSRSRRGTPRSRARPLRAGRGAACARRPGSTTRRASRIVRHARAHAGEAVGARASPSRPCRARPGCASPLPATHSDGRRDRAPDGVRLVQPVDGRERQLVPRVGAQLARGRPASRRAQCDARNSAWSRVRRGLFFCSRSATASKLA